MRENTWGNCFRLQHLLFNETPKMETAQYEQRESCDSVPISGSTVTPKKKDDSHATCCLMTATCCLKGGSPPSYILWSSVQVGKKNVSLIFFFWREKKERGSITASMEQGCWQTPSAKGQYGCSCLFPFLPDPQGQNNPILVG